MAAAERNYILVSLFFIFILMGNNNNTLLSLKPQFAKGHLTGFNND